jgi:hypothetical protein
LAPRHPPRALCSLTSLSNSPEGSCEGTSSGSSPCRYLTAEIEVRNSFSLPITSSLGKVRPPDGRRSGPRARVQRSAGRSVSRDCCLELTDQGTDGRSTHRRRLDASRTVFRGQPEVRRWRRGLPDIRFRSNASRLQTGPSSSSLARCRGWWRRGDSNS